MIKEQTSRPLCSNCRFALAKPNGISKKGFKKWHKYCVECARAMYDGRFKHRQHKKTNCESCGFAPKDQIQLDLCYKDGNKKNKKRDNLITLCANCARLFYKKLRQKQKSILSITVDKDIRIA